MNIFRKLSVRYWLLGIDVILFVLAMVSMFGEAHPLGSAGHLFAMLFGAIGGGLFASIECDRFLLKLYADEPDAPEVRGLL